MRKVVVSYSFIFLSLFFFFFKQNSFANNCALGQAQICSASFGGSSTPKLCSSSTNGINPGISFTPLKPTVGQSVTAKVWANNAERVDVDLFTPNGETGKNGISCGGTTCSFTFTPSVSGTYKVNFNAWDTCGGVVHNHEAYNTVAVAGSTGPTNTPTPTGPAPTPGPFNITVSVMLDSIDTNDAAIQRQPQHLTRNLTLYFYQNANYANDPNGNNAIVETGKVTFTGGDPNNPLTYGTFSASDFTLHKVTPGNYYVLGRVEGSLRQALNNPPTPIAITNGANNPTVLSFSQPLHMGDVVSTNNSIQSIDYSAVALTCYGTKPNTISSDCNQLNMKDDIFSDMPWADLNDDGQIDGIDYNILIRNFGKHGL